MTQHGAMRGNLMASLLPRSPAQPTAEELGTELTLVWLAFLEHGSQGHLDVARVAKWQTLLT